MLQFLKRIAGLLLCLSISVWSAAQQNKPGAPLPDHCASSRAMQNLYKKHPASKMMAEKMEASVKEYVARVRKQVVTLGVQQPVQYTIPIVFHINDPVNPYMVTMDQIRSAMDILNEDYNLMNPDYPLIDSLFIGIAGNLHIHFRLAEIDPQGNPTTGVTYHYNGFDGTSPDGTGSDVKSVSYWPGEKYLNIWVVSQVEQIGVFNNSGWTYLPDSWVASNHLDGVIYNWRYLGAPGVGCSENGYPYMKRVLTHEVGHFLNLWHTFQNGCDAPGDNVDDTPPTQSNFGECNLTANWCGSIANVENYMDYSQCAKMFTNGQKDRMLAALTDTVAERNNLWSAANLASTLLSDSAKRIVPGFTLFMEGDANNGSIALSDTIRTVNAAFAISSGNLTSGSQFTVQNVPAGLTAAIQVINDTTALLSFTGNAQHNNIANNNDSIQVTFLNAAIQGGVSGLYRPGFTVGIHYLDPYTIVYSDLPDIVVNSSSIWGPFNFGVGDAAFGGWLYNGQLRFETYQKAAVCENGTLNISPLAVNTIISASSSFVNGGTYPNEHTIYSSSYTKWAGKTGYIGVRFTLNGKARYGWVRITVAADGSSYVLKGYAYNQAPDSSIRAGDAGAPTLSWSTSQVYESRANDGSITDTSELAIYSAGFAISSGNFTPNVQYTVSNLPAGLSVQITALDSTRARLSFTGKAISNAVANNATVTINILPAAFSGKQSANNASWPISINFRDPYTIKYVKVNDTLYHVNPVNNWYWFLVDNNSDAAYGLWVDTVNLRFETYTKPMVCNGTTQNISLLPLNTIISDSSNFVAGGAYPYEHNVYNTGYTSWKGQTGYAGFSFTTRGENYYGWFRFKVAADGSSYSLLDYAYNTQPFAAIRAGQMLPDTTANVQDYCTASTLLNYNYISRVRLANLDNSSGWDGYKDFTAQTATLMAGHSYLLDVNLNIEYWPEIAVSAWIDWNNDKLLNDTTERVYMKYGYGPFSGTITVPDSAKTGTTLLRVRTGYRTNLMPCGIDTYQGEVEDYTVRIIPDTGMAQNELPAVTSLMAAKTVHASNSLTATNPFADHINVVYQAAVDGDAIVRLYDMNGKIVKQLNTGVTKGANLLLLNNLSALVHGFYVIDVWQGQIHHSGKVIK